MPKRGSNIYKRKDGRWEGRIYKGKKYKSVYGKTCLQVKEKLIKVRKDFEEELSDNDMLFNELLSEWLKYKKKNIKESSYYCYKSKVCKHIMPFFERVRYSAINQEKIYEFISIKTDEGLKSKYISDMVVIIKSTVRWCCKQKGYVNRITSVTNIKISRSDPHLLSASEQKRLQNYLLKQHSFTAMGIYLCMFTGIRIGEICALKWSDIDLENNYLHINKTAQRISDGNSSTVKITPPKTDNSNRIIPLPSFVADILKGYKTENDGFVLSGTDKIVEPRCLSYRFKSILRKANLPQIKFHSLRHIFATNCLQREFDIKTLSEILGHANVNITMRIYIHSSFARKKKCMELLKPI